MARGSFFGEYSNPLSVGFLSLGKNLLSFYHSPIIFSLQYAVAMWWQNSLATLRFSKSFTLFYTLYKFPLPVSGTACPLLPNLLLRQPSSYVLFLLFNSFGEENIIELSLSRLLRYVNEVKFILIKVTYLQSQRNWDIHIIYGLLCLVISRHFN